MKISVVIHTYNEEINLPYALESVKDFDEIIVCDMYSTDKTVEIAKQYGCKVIYFENVGFPEPARTFAIQSATNEWILTVDADEIVPQKLKNYLYKQINKKDCPSGLRLPRKNYFMGKYMRSAYPDYILRFFKREGTVWPPYLHSQPIVKGIISSIPSNRKDLALIHIANENIKAKISKNNLYSEKELLKKKDKKFSSFDLIFGPFYRFLKQYIFKGGILDGRPGLVFAVLNAFTKFIIISKVWEQQKSYSDLLQDIEQSKKSL